MMAYEIDQFVESVDDIKGKFLDLVKKIEIYEAALEAPDVWSVPDVDNVEGSFHYIPYQISGLAELIIELGKVLPDDPDFRHSSQPIRPISFVEVGCGIGRNMNVMRSQQVLPLMKTVGFDIVPEYVETAQKIFGLGEDVFVQDAMTFDYGGYDLVFFYRPFSDDAMQSGFEEYLIDSMKTGAVIIGLNVQSMDKSRKVAAIGRSGNLYKKL